MGLLPSLHTPSFKFETPGTSHTGTLVEIGPEHQASEYNPNGPGDPAFWDKARTRPKMQRKFTFKTNERDPQLDADDGTRVLYAVIDGKPGSQYYAINKALEKASQLGGQLTITMTGFDPESKNPTNPRKLYEATYVEATPSQMLNGGAAQATTASPATAPTSFNSPPQQAPEFAQQAATATAVDEVPAGFTAQQWADMPEATKAAIRAAQQ